MPALRGITPRAQEWLREARDDPLLRTSSLLIADNVGLAGFGAVCGVLATRMWSPYDVGAVAAAIGALSILVAASTLGMPATVVRYLGAELRQGTLMKQVLLAHGSRKYGWCAGCQPVARAPRCAAE